MSGFEFSHRTMRCIFGSIAFCSFLSLLTGCGEADNQPVSAKTSKFEVDAPADKGTAAKPEVGTPAAAAKELAQVAADVPDPPKKPSRTPADESEPNSAEPAAAAGGDGPPVAKEPASNLPARIDPDKLPTGTPDELLAMIQELEGRQPRGTSRQEMILDLKNILIMRMRLADAVFGGKATEDQRLQAAKLKLNAFIDSIQVRFPGAQEGLLAFVKELSTDKSKTVARFGHTMMFQLELGAVTSGDAEAAKKTLVTLKEFLTEDGPQDEFFGPAQQSINALQQGGFSVEATEAVRMVADTYVKSKNPKIVEVAKQLQRFAKIFESGFPAAMTALEKNEPKAAEKVHATIKKLLADSPGPELLKLISEAAQALEMHHHYKIAEAVYNESIAAYKDAPDTKVAQKMELLKRLQEDSELAMKRLRLIGQPFVVDGNTLDGKPFDWSKYKGKIVLVDFWATWCGPCLQEMPNIQENYEKYHEQGFEVVGINLDKDRKQVDEFFSVQSLPWSTVVSADPEAVGFESPMAEKCGVNAIPFVVLIGRDGKVIALHARGEYLGERLAAIFDGDKPAAKDGAKPAAIPDKIEKSKTKGKSSRFQLPAHKASGFVGAEEKEEKVPTTPSAANAQAIVAAKAPATNAAEKKTEPAITEPEGNPYSPREDMTPAELVDFIFNMQEKPKSIQSRPGFSEAIVEAADRILAANSSEKQKLIATLAKCESLHKKACAGSEDADKQLLAFVATLKDDARPKVAEEVRFLLLERQVLDAEKAPLEKVPEVLAELKSYCEKEKLNARHLRMASAAVQAVNRLEDSDQREKYFLELGGLFAKSDNKELSRYGKKLKKKPDQTESELVGKPLELQGTTVEGAPFDWKSYRGKVVLVDFWATWCGPCLREMPNVHNLHEKYHDKGLEVVGISVDADLEALTTFLQKNPVPWTTLAGEDTQELATKYGVRGIPTMMLVDRDGKVLAVSHSANDFAKQIEKLLGDGK